MPSGDDPPMLNVAVRFLKRIVLPVGLLLAVMITLGLLVTRAIGRRRPAVEHMDVSPRRSSTAAPAC